MKTVNDLTIFAKRSIIDVWHGSEYTSGMHILRKKKWNARNLNTCVHLSGWVIYCEELGIRFWDNCNLKRRHLKISWYILSQCPGNDLVIWTSKSQRRSWNPSQTSTMELLAKIVKGYFCKKLQLNVQKRIWDCCNTQDGVLCDNS